MAFALESSCAYIPECFREWISLVHIPFLVPKNPRIIFKPLKRIKVRQYGICMRDFELRHLCLLLFSPNESVDHQFLIPEGSKGFSKICRDEILIFGVGERRTLNFICFFTPFFFYISSTFWYPLPSRRKLYFLLSTFLFPNPDHLRFSDKKNP